MLAGGWQVSGRCDVSACKFQAFEEELAFGEFDRDATSDERDEDGFEVKEGNSCVVGP